MLDVDVDIKRASTAFRQASRCHIIVLPHIRASLFQLLGIDNSHFTEYALFHELQIVYQVVLANALIYEHPVYKTM